MSEVSVSEMLQTLSYFSIFIFQVQLHVQVLLTASTAQLRRVDRQAAIQLTATQHQVATSMFIFREVQPRRENGTKKKTVALIVVNFLQTV